jgi:ribulose-phosphate 3-epimerase
MRPYLLAPSIIASDFTRLADEISACESAGADWIHVDVMDGHFVPTITVGPLFVEACRRATKLPLDVHLMVSNPDQQLEVFAKAGADHITVHVETCPNLLQTIEKIKSLGCKAGITLNPLTPASALDEVLPLVNLVLVMSVTPGYSGQAFMPEMIGKVEEIRNKLNALRSQAWLEVDGGMTYETIPLMYKAGANVFVAGNAAFKHPKGVAQGVKVLQASLQDGGLPLKQP